MPVTTAPMPMSTGLSSMTRVIRTVSSVVGASKPGATIGTSSGATREHRAVKLMTPELIATLADHAQGNLRALMNIAGELLAVAAEREARQIDEKLFLETYAQPPPQKAAAGRRR